MEKYFFITEDSSKTGVPIDLEAGLYEEFIEKEKYIKDHVFPPLDLKHTELWRKKISENDLIKMPEILFLINKHRKIDFDMYYKNDGFIVSNEFKAMIDGINHPIYIYSPLEIRNREGNCNAKKKYSYLKFIEKSLCIDFLKSDVKLYNKYDGRETLIEKYLTRLVLNSKNFITDELFYIDNSYINKFLFCNQETAEYFASKIKTIKAIEINLLFEYLYDILQINRKTKIIIE
jgi:hypothetical protein